MYILISTSNRFLTDILLEYLQKKATKQKFQTRRPKY